MNSFRPERECKYVIGDESDKRAYFESLVSSFDKIVELTMSSAKTRENPIKTFFKTLLTRI